MNQDYLRSEALQILLGILQSSTGRGELDGKINKAIRIARQFAKTFDATEKRASEGVTKFGEFTPSGCSLYFLSFDGSTFLVAEYPTPRRAVDAAIAFNQSIGSFPENSGEGRVSPL